MDEIQFNTTGSLEKKAFFYFSGCTIDLSDDEQQIAPGCVMGQSRLLKWEDTDDFMARGVWGDYAGQERIVVQRCSLHPNHILRSRLTRTDIDLFGGQIYCEFIPTNYSGAIVTSTLRDQIAQSGALGCHFSEVAVNVSHPARANLRLHRISGNTAFLERPKILPKGRPNHCPDCGTAPLICPACAYQEFVCSKCSKRLMLGGPLDYLEKHGIPYHIQDRPPEGKVFDGASWSGDDVMESPNHELIVTRRFVDFLLAIHVGPFVALPIQIWTDGMSKQQREWLERAKKPLGC